MYGGYNYEKKIKIRRAYHELMSLEDTHLKPIHTYILV
jgi:hypothetical protein